MPSESNVNIEPGRLYIGGQWVESASGATFKTINPATEKPLAQIAEGRAEDVDRAVRAARVAFSGGDWPKMSPADRGRIIWKIGDLIESRIYDNAMPFGGYKMSGFGRELGHHGLMEYTQTKSVWVDLS